MCFVMRCVHVHAYMYTYWHHTWMFVRIYTPVCAYFPVCYSFEFSHVCGICTYVCILDLISMMRDCMYLHTTQCVCFLLCDFPSSFWMYVIYVWFYIRINLYVYFKNTHLRADIFVFNFLFVTIYVGLCVSIYIYIYIYYMYICIYVYI
jgi:hypothetical protein